MQFGCKRDICVNEFCHNNPNFVKPANEQEMYSQSVSLWKGVMESQKYKLYEILCDQKQMNQVYSTLQSHNLDSASDFNFLAHLCSSPYSLSLSFLDDISLIGKKDDLGHLKYKLNLNEKMVA